MNFRSLFSPVKKIQPNSPSPVNTAPAANDEITHITQEMYKKNMELAEKNKTLSILQKIDEIVLSSATDAIEIAKEVTKVLVEDAEFSISAIYMIKEAKAIHVLSIYLTDSTYEMHEAMLKKIYTFKDISISQTDNLLVKALVDKEVKKTDNLSDFFKGLSLDAKSIDEINQVQREANIKTSFVYPLLVRGQVIGGMIICLNESTEELSDYHKDLLSRLHGVIGIAMDNALLYKQVQDKNEQLKVLDKLKSEFVSVASHELRTPMTAIKSYLWMTLDGRGGHLTEKQKWYLDRAYQSTDRLIKLVNDMLNVSRIESGRLTVAMGKVLLDKMASEVLSDVLSHAKELGVEVMLYTADFSPVILGDADKLKEVFFNLIGNSLKFTSRGGRIGISFRHVDNMVRTEISDTGVGIDPIDIPKLFQKFGLVEGSYTSNQSSVQGTGLGLYISKSIIELHSGTISVSSQGKGKGAIFAFTLPVFSEEAMRAYNVSHEHNGKEVGLIHT